MNHGVETIPSGVGDADLEWRELSVPPEWSAKRIDAFVAAHAPDHLSRMAVQSLLRRGFVLLDGKPPKGTSTRVAEGQSVSFAVPLPDDAAPEPQDIPLDILFEDEDLVVLSKPAGLVVHPAPGYPDGTLVNALLHHCRGQLSGIGGVKRPGIVHRLDRDTSGVMVAAKSYRAHVGLQEQFADHGRSGPLRRAYRALVWGEPSRKIGTVDAPLGRHPQSRTKRAVVGPEAPDAKEAITHFTVLEPLGEATLLECRLETGRTHQIRVHMAHSGHPLLGDREYGRHFETKAVKLDDGARNALSRLGRQALHAFELGFAHPATGEAMLFEAPLPPDFADLLEALRTGT